MSEPSTFIAIQTTIQKQRAFFSTHVTKEIAFRKKQLHSLKTMIITHEKEISEALFQDLHKSYEESYLTEISIVLQEIDQHLKHLNLWQKPKKVRTPLALFPSKSYIYKEPLGVALIISPWNYPLQLLINPLVGAISAGCTAVLKPSPYAKAFEKLIIRLIRKTFDPQYIDIAIGGREVNTLLLQERWDMIFFTGSPNLGKIVMQAAANFLTPVVLELGGKSPCIVDKDAQLEVAAQRIIWGKCINAGQTCIAPDYILAHESIKEQLIIALKKAIEKQYGKDPQQSKYYPRIVNKTNVLHLQTLMQKGTIVYGGKVDLEDRYIAPTILDHVLPKDPIMQDEIFGPLLPIMTFGDISQALDYINIHEKPLAFYYFGSSKKVKDILYKTSSGGGCINDVLMHIANDRLPFGGVGNSGMQAYHGIESFKCFSNQRSIVQTPTWIDLPMKYAPFKYFKWIKKLL